MTLLTYLFIIVFLVGLYFYAKCADPKYLEGLTNNSNTYNSNTPRCPNLLIQKGSKLFIYNSQLAKVPGVNVLFYIYNIVIMHKVNLVILHVLE